MKKLIILLCLAFAISACSTTDFKSGDVSKETILHISKKRQKVLETSKDKELHRWSHSGINGEMYIFSTWKKADGKYCRRLYERVVYNFKELEIYNEWCRIGKGKWAVVAR